MIMNKPISEIDVKNIQLMLTRGFKTSEIAKIIGCSDHTVTRVKNGTHALLRPKTPKPIEKQSGDLKTKLDAIIELLKEIKSSWG